MSLLIAVLARGLALSVVATILLAALRRASPATRHAVCAISLGAMLALPFGLIYAPKREIPIRPVVFRSATRSTFVPHVAEAPAPVVPSAPALPEPTPLPVEAILVGVWAVGASFLALRALFGWATVWGWARRGRPLSPHPFPSSTGGRGGRTPCVRVSGEVAVPLVLWAGRSVILLPASHADWSEDRRRAVLAHEAAHVARADWAALLLARLTLALHWPNPFAWGLVRFARRAAEDAADDAVLRTGLVPADYAAHLLDLARAPLRAELAVPMAHRPDVHRRIHRVLNPQRTRGSASLATLLVASGLLGGVFVPTVCLVADGIPKGKDRPPTIESMVTDVRSGRTRPGTLGNGFVGRFADGTTAQVVQISMRTPTGIRAWRPNGAPIPEARRRAVEHLGDHYRSILVRYRRRTAAPDGGLGSGPATEGAPSVLGFNSSRNQRGPRRGEGESYQFIEVPKEDGDRASFTFALANEPWRTYTFPNDPHGRPKRLARLLDAGNGTRLHDAVAEHGTAHPVLRGPNHLYLKDAKGVPRRGSAPSTCLAFSTPTDGKTYAAEVTARLRNGRTVKPFWNDNGNVGDAFRFRYHFHETPKEIASFGIRTRGYASVEFLGVRLKPNGGRR